MWNHPDKVTFEGATETSVEIIKSLRWELDRQAPATYPFAEATIDPELWGHIRGLAEANDWEKVGREAAVFVESKLREWAGLQAVKGCVDVFKTALGPVLGITEFSPDSITEIPHPLSGVVGPKKGPPIGLEGSPMLTVSKPISTRSPPPCSQ